MLMIWSFVILLAKIINFILFLLEINSAEEQKIINKIIFLIIVLCVTDNQLKNLIIWTEKAMI